MNKERLLNVAKALRESPDPENFNMQDYVHCCGTPACAFGHYAFRTDLQDEFKVSRRNKSYSGLSGFAICCTSAPDPSLITYTNEAVLKHFDIDRTEAETLFGAYGCGDALTAIEAAEFIEDLVRRHE
jgi:hypothetical protein